MCIYKYLYTYAYVLYIYMFYICAYLCIYIYTHIHMCEASQVVLVVKNPLANSGDLRDSGSIPGWGRSPGGGHGNPLQDSCLENPRDRGAWWATVHGSQRVGHDWATRAHIERNVALPSLNSWPDQAESGSQYLTLQRCVCGLGTCSILTKMFSSLYESYYSLILVSFSFFEHHLKTKNK